LRWRFCPPHTKQQTSVREVPVPGPARQRVRRPARGRPCVVGTSAGAAAMCTADSVAAAIKTTSALRCGSCHARAARERATIRQRSRARPAGTQLPAGRGHTTLASSCGSHALYVAVRAAVGGEFSHLSRSCELRQMRRMFRFTSRACALYTGKTEYPSQVSQTFSRIDLTAEFLFESYLL
jgi:hypothetical protein